MNAKKCDRCGKCYDAGIVTSLVLERRVIFSYVNVDLCPECAIKLKEWFNLKPKEIEESEESPNEN